MATREKRVGDLEYIIGHLPEDLDARFAGVDTKLAAIREVLALHTTRFTTLERRFDGVESQFGRRLDTIEGKLDQIIERLPKS